MSIVSDSKEVSEPKDPDTSIIFQIHSLFLNDEEKQTLKTRYVSGGVGYGDLKKSLLDQVMNHFEPFRKKEKNFRMI